jgi:ribosomal protein S18 acetylase RimI-like enzyme
MKSSSHAVHEDSPDMPPIATTIQTRIATLADADAVAPLFDAYRQFYEQTADLPLATRFIRDRLRMNESVILLATVDHKILGFCQLYPTFCSIRARPICALYDLFVLPEARRCGAGKALLQAAERYAAQNGFSRLDLTTAKTNSSAQSLYESLGWVRDEVFDAYSKDVEG